MRYDTTLVSEGIRHLPALDLFFEDMLFGSPSAPGPGVAVQTSWPATTDLGTLVLALVTTMLQAGAVAGISHSAVAMIRSTALITAGIAITLVILRPSCC